MTQDQARTLLAQIGRMNVLAISGGRWIVIDGVLVLPVATGYRVEIEYVEGRDTYTVRRLFTRGIKRWIKGEVTDVYADQVGEIAYQASCFRSDEFGQEVTA